MPVDIRRYHLLTIVVALAKPTGMARLHFVDQTPIRVIERTVLSILVLNVVFINILRQTGGLVAQEYTDGRDQDFSELHHFYSSISSHMNRKLKLLKSIDLLEIVCFKKSTTEEQKNRISNTT